MVVIVGKLSSVGGVGVVPKEGSCGEKGGQAVDVVPTVASCNNPALGSDEISLEAEKCDGVERLNGPGPAVSVATVTAGPVGVGKFGEPGCPDCRNGLGVATVTAVGNATAGVRNTLGLLVLVAWMADATYVYFDCLSPSPARYISLHAAWGIHPRSLVIDARWYQG